MRTWSLRILRQVFRLALSAFHWLTVAMVSTFKSRTALQVENLALRHQLAVLRRSVKRPKVTSADRLFWAWLCDAWMAILIAHRQARNRHWLASPRLSIVLDLESSSRPTWASIGVQKDSATDSQDKPRQSALGCTAHSR